MRDESKIPLRILIIGNDPDILNVLNIAFGSMGYEVDVLRNGKYILQNQFVVPDLFILDKELPDIDGLDICHFLKSKANYKDVPVIILSANRRVKKKAMESGAIYFAEKPFDMHELARAVRHALEFPEDSIKNGRDDIQTNPDPARKV